MFALLVAKLVAVKRGWRRLAGYTSACRGGGGQVLEGDRVAVLREEGGFVA
jgi:hypothetical protein